MASEHHLQLLRLIESQVLPRLVESLGSGLQTDAPAACVGLPHSVEGVKRFAQILAGGDRVAIDESVHQLVNAGIPRGSIFLHVLAPTARHLCDRWERNECSFHEVSTGLIQLLSILRRLRGPQHWV